MTSYPPTRQLSYFVFKNGSVLEVNHSVPKRDFFFSKRFRSFLLHELFVKYRPYFYIVFFDDKVYRVYYYKTYFLTSFKVYYGKGLSFVNSSLIDIANSFIEDKNNFYKNL